MSIPVHETAMSIIHFLADLAKVTITLFIVLDPIGLTPFLYSVTAHRDPVEVKGTIFRVVAGATILLLFFTAMGTWVLSFFGVTLNDLSISGGLLLLIIALQLVVQGHESGEPEREQKEMSETPLISPLLVGPGAITASVVLASNYGVILTSLGAILAMIVSLLIFLSTRFLHKLIGDSGTDLIRRIFGVLIAAVGVSYMRVGITALITQR